MLVPGAEQSLMGRRAGHDELGAEQYGAAFHLVVVDASGLLVEPVGHRFEVPGDHGDFLGGRLEAVGEVAAMREVKNECAHGSCSSISIVQCVNIMAWRGGQILAHRVNIAPLSVSVAAWEKGQY